MSKNTRLAVDPGEQGEPLTTHDEVKWVEGQRSHSWTETNQLDSENQPFQVGKTIVDRLYVSFRALRSGE
jgi:hypothetical protein